MSIESDIIDKIVDLLKNAPELAEINYVSADEIKLATSDFERHELPAIQIWDNGQIPTHERGRILVDWNISAELIMRSSSSGLVDQKALFELRRKIMLVLFNKPNLGIPGVVHLIYTGNISDLHLAEPEYIARVDFTVRYYDNLVSEC